MAKQWEYNTYPIFKIQQRMNAPARRILINEAPIAPIYDLIIIYYFILYHQI